MEFNNTTMKDAALQCGFILQQCPPRVPEWKGSIERFFGTMTRNFVREMPGTTRSNPQCLAEEENPMKKACISFSSFLELVHKWVIDVYSQDYHSGLKAIPSKIWNEGVRIHRPTWPNDISELAILLGKVEFRKIRRTGIALNNHTYNSNELNELLHKLTKHQLNFRVKVKYDPNDISYIYVLDDIIDNKWIKVPSTNLDYAMGLTELEHKEISRQARERYGTVDEIALAEAKRYIFEKAEENIELIQKFKKKRINSTNEISTTIDINKYLTNLKLNDRKGSILNRGYKYKPILTSNAVIIKGNNDEPKKTHKVKNKKLTENKAVGGNELESLERKDNSSSLDDLNLDDYTII